MLALYIVAGIVLFILLVFSIPVDMAFEVGGPGAARSRMRVGWLFGLLGKEFGRSGRTRKKPKEQASKRKKKKRSAKPYSLPSQGKRSRERASEAVQANPRWHKGEASGCPPANRAG